MKVGLPHEEIFAAVGSKVYVTGLNGWLRVTSDGESYRVETERSDEGAPK